MENLRIVICDPDKSSLEGYAKVCRDICRDQQFPAVVTEISSSQTLLFDMSDSAFASMVSILILDPEKDCEAVAATLRKGGYDGIILYISRFSHNKYFFQAFDAGVHNCVEKGDLKRFAKVFSETLKAAKHLERQCIAVSCGGEYQQIDIRDIYYFETTMDHMVCVWHNGGKFIFQSSLSNLETRLKERGFIRAHRSYLVALESIHRVSYGEIILNNGKSIPVGRSYYTALKRAMDNWYLEFPISKNSLEGSF